MILINLLPVRAQRKRQALLQYFVVSGAGLIVLGIVLFVLNGNMNSQVTTLEAKNKEVANEIENLKKIIGEIEVYEKMIAERQKKKDIIEDLKKGRQGPVRILDEVALRIPKRVWLTRLRNRESAITFRGLAVNQRVVADFMKALGESEYFSSVNLREIKKAESDSIEFKIHEFEVSANIVNTQEPSPSAGEGDGPADGGAQ